MSHHIVTVCVVCVLCAAHVPCSAHTNASTAVPTTADLTSPRNRPPSPDAQRQPLWTLEGYRDPAYSKDRHKSHPSNFSSNNKRVVARSRYARHSVDGARANVVGATPADTYVEWRIKEKFKDEGSARDTARPSAASASVTTVSPRDAEILERLAQTGPRLGSDRKPDARTNDDSRTVSKSRLKRDVAMDERYFMRKLFEAYGDGTSITIEGFEKLVRKLGLLKLLTDASAPANGSINRGKAKRSNLR